MKQVKGISYMSGTERHHEFARQWRERLRQNALESIQRRKEEIKKVEAVASYMATE